MWTDFYSSTEEGRLVTESHRARRERIKQYLLKRRGGKCVRCGYSKSPSALCFHHRDPKNKLFNISGVRLIAISLQRLEKEADKCDVLCANCHAEVHDHEGWVHENGR